MPRPPCGGCGGLFCRSTAPYRHVKKPCPRLLSAARSRAFPLQGHGFGAVCCRLHFFLPFSGMLKRAGAQCRRRKSPEKRAAREQGRQGRFGISDAGRRFSFRHASAACASYAGEGEYACAKDVLCRKYALHLSDIRGRVPVLFTGSNAQPTFPACFSREEKLRAPERSMLQQDL